MKKIVAILLLIAAMPLGPCLATAQIVSIPGEQIINTDSVRAEYDKGPYFSLYKDNYFIFGTAIGQKPTKQNSNVKFQISVQQKLTKSVLPWHTYLYLFYTQKVFWNILEESLPMTDLNFNPGIGIAKPLFVKNRYIGKLSLVLEHESNGRDGEASRSWNRVTFGANIIIDNSLCVHGKIWIPIIDGKNNKDILKYCGIFQVGTSYLAPDQRWGGSLVLVKRQGWNFHYNAIFELYYKLFKDQNQFLFLQYYYGYGEGLLDYKQLHSQLRVGIVIRPKFFSDY